MKVIPILSQLYYAFPLLYHVVCTYNLTQMQMASELHGSSWAQCKRIENSYVFAMYFLFVWCTYLQITSTHITWYVYVSKEGGEWGCWCGCTPYRKIFEVTFCQESYTVKEKCKNAAWKLLLPVLWVTLDCLHVILPMLINLTYSNCC